MKVGAPTGTTMNSCRSIELAAWTPPLITFSIGTGSVAASSPPRWRYSGCPLSAAAAFAAASETPRIAFAPRRPLFSVPSRAISFRSSASWSSASTPASSPAISPLTFATAFVTPLPPQGAPPSRSSTASCTPVEAPDGTAARPKAPDSSSTSTSTVGLPRESRIWRPCSRLIALIRVAPLPGRSSGPARRAAARSSARLRPPRAARPARPARRTAYSYRGAPAPGRR